MNWSSRINELANQIRDWRKEKGFHTPDNLTSVQSKTEMLGKLMLVVTEVAEAAEAVRDGDIQNFNEEVSDAMIRLFDIAGTCGIDLEKELFAKMDKNALRPIRHGRKSVI